MAVVVNGDSMWPTLNDGETIHVIPFQDHQLMEGDIVVFFDDAIRREYASND